MGDFYCQKLNPIKAMAQEMEPAPEGEVGGDTALICGEVFGVGATAVELSEVGEIGKDEISGLQQLVNLRTLVVRQSRFSDDGWVELLRILRLLPLTTLELSGCGLGPRHAADLAELFRGAMAGVNRLTVDSTGDPRNPKSYTLTVGEETIDLSSKNLGPADVNFLAVWLQRPEVNAALTVAKIIGNPIGPDGAKLMIEAFDANPQLQSLCGITPGSTSADLSSSNMGPNDCLILAHELHAGRAGAALNSLTLDKNPIFGELYGNGNVKTVDKFVAEVQPLLDAVKSSSLTSLSLAGTGMGAKGVDHGDKSLERKFCGHDLALDWAQILT